MRRRIYEIIEIAKDGDKASAAYDYSMIALIILSVIPLAFKESVAAFDAMEKIATAAFIIDYALRLATADYHFGDKSAKSFVRYPFSPMAVIDLMSILPSVAPVNSGLRLLRIFRMVRAMKVVRVFKAARYSKNVAIVAEVLRRSKETLLTVCILAVGYIIVAALIIFNVEPESFSTFFDAIYWAAVSLTTVGYGDIYAVSTAGRIITIISAFFGVAIIALPSGIITAGYLDVIEENKGRNEEKSKDPK